MQEEIKKLKDTRNFLTVVIVVLLSLALFLSSDYRRAQKLESLVCNNLDIVDYSQLSEVYGYCAVQEEGRLEKQAGKENI